MEANNEGVIHKKLKRLNEGPGFFSMDTYIFDDSSCEYKLGQNIGNGAFGVVKIGAISQSNKKVAIKIQNISRQIEYHTKTLGDEKRARLYVLEQINIEDTLLQLTGQFISSIRRTNLKNQEKHYSVMEYIDGGLLKNIFQTLSFEKQLQCFIEITQQMVFLHEHNYLHLDIWRENILFDGQARLNDYGCAAKLVDGCFLSKLKGSHIPPEIINAHQKKEDGVYGAFSDIYALGMTFYELLYEDYYDYSLDNSLGAFIKRYSEYYLKVAAILHSNSDPLSQLIHRMISSSANRPESKEIISSLNQINANSSLVLMEDNQTVLMMKS